MPRFRFSVPSPALVIASLALFVALTGSVYAGVKLARNSVGTDEIKNKSIKGADIANDSVTGAQIDETTLGVVPRAATSGTAGTATSAATAGSAKTADRAASAAAADRAAYADRTAYADRAATAEKASDSLHASSSDRLAGHPSTDFASSSTTFPVAAKLRAGDSQVLVDRDGVKLEARCATGAGTLSGGTATALTVYASSTTDGATLESPKADFDGSTPDKTLGPSVAEKDRIALQSAATTGTNIERIPAEGIILTSAGGTTIFFGTTGGIRTALGLNGATCSVSAPVVVATP